MTAPLPRLRLLLVGYGRLGRLVEVSSGLYGFDVAGRLDAANNAAGAGFDVFAAGAVDVAVDFSTGPALVANFPRLVALGAGLVIGTTGWQAEEPRLRAMAEAAGVGVVAAPNFSVGMVLFQELAAASAALFGARDDFGAWIHETHHAAKRDAPSGTALALRAAMAQAGYTRAIDVAASRAGHVPGTHTVAFDGPSETVTLTHAVRDRSTFAHGALAAARWVHGRRGWFGMRDVLGLASAPPVTPTMIETGGPR
jgi:4-hydroxy-tetrahydrodipicolinate reductase